MTEPAAGGGVRELFEGLVPSEVADAYDRLLEGGGWARDQAEGQAGGARVVRALTELGMAQVQPHSPTRPAWLQPASPDLALQGVLVAHQNRLASGQELLLDGHRRLAAAQARYGAPVTGPMPAHLVSVVSDREQITQLSASLMNTARQDWMTLDDLRTEMPLTDEFAQPPLPAFAGQVRCRAIYAAAAMDDPAGRRIIQACAEAGEQARLLAEVPMKLKLADHTTALLPLTPTGTAGALVVHAPVIIAALRDYFELLWERATPLNTPHPTAPPRGLTRAQQKVLNLMAEGLHDEAIARRAGISVTTVRRHVTAVMARLGVSSRFAAGAAAQRRGWIA